MKSRLLISIIVLGMMGVAAASAQNASLENLDLIVKSYREQQGAAVREGLGIGPVAPVGAYVQVTAGETPIFGAPGVRADTLTIVGLAKSGEYFQLAETRVLNPSVMGSMASLNFLNSKAVNEVAETWFRVVAKSGEEGWIAQIATTTIEIAPPPPPPPPLVDPSVVPRIFGFIAAVLLLGVTAVAALRVFRKTPTA